MTERFCISDNPIRTGSALIVQQQRESKDPTGENSIEFYMNYSMRSNQHNKNSLKVQSLSTE
jgi:hypothetical protein